MRIYKKKESRNDMVLLLMDANSSKEKAISS